MAIYSKPESDASNSALSRILVTTNAPSRHLSPLLNGWQQGGIEVSVVTSRPSDRFSDGVSSCGLFWQVLRTSFRKKKAPVAEPHISVLGFLRLARNSDVAVVCGYSTMSSILLLLVPARLRSPTVLLAERPDLRTTGVRRLIRDSIIKIAVRRVGAVWAMSAGGAETYRKLGGNVTAIVPYPVPELDMPIHFERTLGDGQPIRVVVIGTLDDRKDPVAAIEALKILDGLGVPFEAEIYGDGPLIGPVKKAAEGLPIEVLGAVPHGSIWQVLFNSHILLHPSKNDGWGMVVAEAVAAKVAVLAGPATDAAVEFSRIGSTVYISELSPLNLAEALVEIRGRLMRQDADIGLEEMRTKAKLRFGTETLVQVTTSGMRQIAATGRTRRTARRRKARRVGSINGTG